MAYILHIETSTEVCSVSLSDNGALLLNKEEHNGPSHAATLGSFVDEILSMADSHALPLEAVAVSCGPGSYTGLRIGVSMGKGICYGRSLPLIAVPTLQVMCVPLLLGDQLPDDALLCPMIDARRSEVYCALYDRALAAVQPTAAVVVEPQSFARQLSERPVYFFGNGAAKCREIIAHPNARFVEGIEPLARHMFPLAERAFANGRFEDVAYFEPYYLKDFVASKPKDLLNPAK